MTRLEQLERMVEVLRDGIREAMGRHFESEGVQADRAWDDLDDALAESARIAAEPVELTDAEVVERGCRGVAWYDHGADGHELGDLRVELAVTLKSRELKVFQCASTGAAYAEAAAWIRAQGAER